MPVPLLIYDGDCPICCRALAWMRENVPPGRLDYLTCQSPERPARAPQVAAEDCMRAMQLVMPDGTVYAGERALPLVIAQTRRHAWLRHLFAVPGGMFAARRVYSVIARNRMQLSAFFKINLPGGSCSVDKGCP